MKIETSKKLTYIINLSFFLYFIILICERMLSVVLSLVNGVNLYSDGFNGYTYTALFVSIGAFIIYLLIRCRDNIKALFVKKEDIHFTDLCIASGILLVSGMVHTEYTIPVIQFISYGILIIGILIKVIMNVYSGGNKVLHWLSFIYLVAFSMAIPVMYRSFIDQNTVFHILEAVNSLFLVVVFTYLLILVFENNDDLFIIWTVALMAALDAVLIALRWSEEINYFVLIFAGVAVLTFIVGYIYKLTNKRNRE